jgi:diphthamide biosynthesis protein 3
MSQSVYDEIEIEDMEYIEEDPVRGPHYTYPCPCGDKFFITMEDLENGEEIAYCPGCTLKIRVIYDPPEEED